MVQRPVLDRLVGAVGQIVVPSQEQDRRVQGSGVIVGPEGLVVTSYHVVQGLDSRIHAGVSSDVFFNPTDPSRTDFPLDAKKMFRLQFVRAEFQADLVLFRIAKYADGRSLPAGQKFPWLRLGNFEAIKILDPVFVMGFPQIGGDTLTVVEGKVAGKDAAHEWIKVDASLSRGYSGGAVINSSGELLGIATEIRADVEELDPERKGSPSVKVLYGIMNWVRPSSVLGRLMKIPAQVPRTVDSSLNAAVIGGRITSSQGKPVIGALVGLLKEGSQLASAENLISYARTDTAGQFQIRTAPGKYTLRIAARGFEPRLEAVELKQIPKTLQITLNGMPLSDKR
ncbi:MAG TPA: trypsin-like peptidase domain-containing protein [Candidatus Angelobacter sp.]|nr:trypsin-like peptidase domain-containing protein [Candidatus Angelobacter sp.]